MQCTSRCRTPSPHVTEQGDHSSGMNLESRVVFRGLTISNIDAREAADRDIIRNDLTSSEFGLQRATRAGALECDLTAVERHTFLFDLSVSGSAAIN